MYEKESGGSAFPVNTSNSGEAGAFYPDAGMTLRDYFAAKAMQARLTRIPQPLPAPQWFEPGHELDDAKLCYAVADAMLKARDA